MKELKRMFTELNNQYNAKEELLKRKPNFNSHKQGELNNLKLKLGMFLASIGQVSDDPLLKKEIINNFKSDAESIKSEINKLA